MTCKAIQHGSGTKVNKNVCMWASDHDMCTCRVIGKALPK